MRVAVTGAGGFIGRHVVEGLASHGHAVRAVTSAAAVTLPPGVERHALPNLLDRAELASAFRDADAVVHLAGRAHVTRERAGDPLSEFRRVNVEGTRACVDAAVASKVQHFVLLSSVAAVAAPDAGFLPHDPTPRPSSPYGVSKLEAESLLRATAHGIGMRSSVLRPPMVYGPGMKGNPLRLFRLIDRGVPLPFGAVRNARSMLFVGNLVAAIEAVLLASAPVGAGLFVTDGESLSTSELVRRAGLALGRHVRQIPIPTAVLRALGRAGDALSRLAPTPLSSATVDSLVGTLVLDDAPIRALMGCALPFTVDEGLRLSAQWFGARAAAGP